MSQTKAELIKGLNINASAPATALTIDSSGQIEAGSLGTASSPVYSFFTDQNTGIYSPGADQVAVATNGSGRLFVDSSGQVGIGGSPGAPLHVKPGSGDSYINVTSVTSSASVIFNDSGTGGNYPKVGSEGNNLVLRGGSLNNAVTIDSSQRVGVGTASPSVALEVSSNSNLGSRAIFTRPDVSRTVAIGANRDTSDCPFVGTTSNSAFAFITNDTERARIDTSGRLGIGTSSPGAKLDISGSGNLVRLGDGTNTFDVRFQGPNNWDVQLDTSADTFSIRRNSSSKVTVSPAGNVGVGTTSPTYLCNVIAAAGSQNIFQAGQTGISNGYTITSNGTNLTHAWFNGGSEAARIDSSGRLLVGTSTSSSVGALVQVRTGAANNHIEAIRSSDDAGGPAIWLTKSRGTAGSPTEVSNGDQLGFIVFRGHDGVDYRDAAYIYAEADGTWTDSGDTTDNPSRLVFSTTADGASSPTERMRITSGGYLKATTTGTQVSTNRHGFRANQTDYVFQVSQENNSGAGITIDCNSDTTALDALNVYSTSSAGDRLNIKTNGNVVNTNNSYGAISDVKLKENIIDATSQWADLKALQVRKYNFKEGQTHTQIGLVAQEVELVSPGLVTESPDRDAEGNDLGTVTKSVNYSVLYMKAVKALQEAMERIEQLETEMTTVKAQLS